MTFEQVGAEVGALVDKKNLAYGNSFELSGEFMKILFPNGIQPSQYTDMLLLIRMFDKMMRIANQKEAFDESPYADLAGYSILGTAKDTKSRK